MKHLSVVIALAAASFCSSSQASPRSGQTSATAQYTRPDTRPERSLEKYKLWMAKGLAIRVELAKKDSRSKSEEAVEAFRYAILHAPTLPQGAEAWVERGEVQYEMWSFAAARMAFRNAIKSELSPDYKRRALFGVAQTEFRRSKGIDTLKNDAPRLRANYDAALKAGSFTENYLRDMWSHLAQLSIAEGKHLEAARHYTKLLETIPAERISYYDEKDHGEDAIAQLKLTANLTSKEQSEAADLVDRIYAKTLRPRKDVPQNQALILHDWKRIEYSKMLAQFGQAARAEKLRNEIANGTDVNPVNQAGALALIAQAQTAQKNYNAALLTLDRIDQRVPLLVARRHFERAQVFIAQQKWDAAAAEYAKVPTISAIEADEKVEAYWGMADLAALRIESLRRRNAPATEIAAQVAEQGSKLKMAALETTAQPSLIYKAKLKMAQWERAQGNEEEAKKWE